ncbi:MAG: hypothetical protein AB2693_28030 [Candidatus Thiodiazotropha sp.]
MTNNANNIQREIKVKGQKLGAVTSFKYLGAIVSDEGSKPEVLSRIALVSHFELPQWSVYASIASHLKGLGSFL